MNSQLIKINQFQKDTFAIKGQTLFAVLAIIAELCVQWQKIPEAGFESALFISIIKSFFHRLKIRMENNQTQIIEFFTVAQLKINQLMTVYKKGLNELRPFLYHYLLLRLNLSINSFKSL